MELTKQVVQECVDLLQQNPELHAAVIPEVSFGENFWAACKVFERSFYNNTSWIQAARFFRASTFRHIGGFNESMISGEDFDIHNRVSEIVQAKSVQKIHAHINHNERRPTLRSIWKKKYYYGKHIHVYKTQPQNRALFSMQSNPLRRLRIFLSEPTKIIHHPLLFIGTIVLKATEFAAGGAGYLVGNPSSIPTIATTNTSTNLPSVSFVICTFNSKALIRQCLSSITNLDYPKDLVEIIAVDGGSTDGTQEVLREFRCTIVDERTGRPEAATAIGYQAASNDVIINFPSDNVIIGTQWLRDMVQPFIDHPTIVGSYTLRYEHRREDTPLNRCFALFGAGDPVAYYMNKRDRATYFEDGWPFDASAQDCGKYYLVQFDEHNLPTVGANGFLLRKHFAHMISREPLYFFHIDSTLDLVHMGYRTFAVVKNGIWHRTGESFKRFFQRRMRYIAIYYRDKKIRRYHVFDPSKDTWRLVLCILYSLTIIEPTLEAVRGYIKVRDWAWFLHPVISFLCVIIYSYTVMSIWLKNKFNQNHAV
jgi:glycosyltransferase involved in cell wall biosynthesis